MSLLNSFNNLVPVPFETTWKSPSNIAFVKYWGKKAHQLPANPSLSMTLKECVTKTTVTFIPHDVLHVEVFLDGRYEENFSFKIKKYLESLSDFPWIQKVSFKIRTQNTFPHGTGIASSASGLSAFCLCLTEYIYFLSSMAKDQAFIQTASYLSRLASGSASRSVYGGFSTWGESTLLNSSDLYATPFEAHPELEHLHDTVLVISGQEKLVSSTVGHGRMNEHSFAQARFTQARNNFDQMVHALKTGDIEKMGSVLESEALSLHAMMLTSPNPYTLLRPHTLTAIDMIWRFRKETKIPLFFTLDAGPNLHLIYPSSSLVKIKTFISNELSHLTERVIDDQRGEGPISC